MTPPQSALGAEQTQTWSAGLRITEADRAGFDSSQQSWRNSHAGILHTAYGHLQTAWRWLERKRTQQMSAKRLRVAETVSLGEKRSVSIIQVDGSQYLIGSSAGSVQLLAVLSTKNAMAERES